MKISPGGRVARFPKSGRILREGDLKIMHYPRRGQSRRSIRPGKLLMIPLPL